MGNWGKTCARFSAKCLKTIFRHSLTKRYSHPTSAPFERLLPASTTVQEGVWKSLSKEVTTSILTLSRRNGQSTPATTANQHSSDSINEVIDLSRRRTSILNITPIKLTWNSLWIIILLSICAKSLPDVPNHLGILSLALSSRSLLNSFASRLNFSMVVPLTWRNLCFFNISTQILESGC